MATDHIIEPEGVRPTFTLGEPLPESFGGAFVRVALAQTSRHGGFDGSLRVKLTGPMPQIAITTGSLWLGITPS